MAVLPRIISLNLGSQTIGLAEFQAQPNGGLILSGQRFREILTDAADEGARNAQMARVLREMMGELQLKGGRVNYAVAAQSVFARFVKLPAVEEEKIERIIGFEAQQNVPFPIDEVVWNYQLVGGGAEGLALCHNLSLWRAGFGNVSLDMMTSAHPTRTPLIVAVVAVVTVFAGVTRRGAHAGCSER